MANKIVYVSFSAEINVSTAEQLIVTMTNCLTQGFDEVHLLFSSGGGNVSAGINLYNLLRGMPFQLITHNVANVDSIATAVFLAGDQRYTCPDSTFMFHGVRWGTGNTNPSEGELREYLLNVQADQRRIAAIIAERTRLGVAEVEAFFREAATKDAAYAAEMGLVDEVRPVQVPAGVPVWAHAFNR
jgi:ATP-dependent Clp protease protease subunit